VSLIKPPAPVLVITEVKNEIESNISNSTLPFELAVNTTKESCVSLITKERGKNEIVWRNELRKGDSKSSSYVFFKGVF